MRGICGAMAVVSVFLNVYNENRKKIKEVPKVKKIELEIETIGEPKISVLPEAEQQSFFETLLARIKELKEQNEK